MTIKFSSLPKQPYQSEHENRWISQKLTEGEFNYYLVLEIISLKYNPGYMVGLSIVSPDQLKKYNPDIVQKKWNKNIFSDEIKLAEALYFAGIHVIIISQYGLHRQKLLEMVQEKIPTAIESVNYYMNQIVDTVDITGWELLSGKTLCDIYGEINNGN